jgi:hypothetical protein
VAGNAADQGNNEQQQEQQQGQSGGQPGNDPVKANQDRVDGYLGAAGLPPHKWC